MNTCETCTEFDAKNERCNCPLHAYPNVYSGEYTYARTAKDCKACTFYMQVVVKDNQ